MNRLHYFIALFFVFLSCNEKASEPADSSLPLPLVGTWKLLSATIIENGDTSITSYTENGSFIKVINPTHFAFLYHDLNKGKEATAAFSAGGGRYTLHRNEYTEQLEYCSDRRWEGNDFHFTITIKNDTLLQQGVEVVESAGINRINIEKYLRVTNR